MSTITNLDNLTLTLLYLTPLTYNPLRTGGPSTHSRATLPYHPNPLRWDPALTYIPDLIIINTKALILVMVLGIIITLRVKFHVDTKGIKCYPTLED